MKPKKEDILEYIDRYCSEFRTEKEKAAYNHYFASVKFSKHLNNEKIRERYNKMTSDDPEVLELLKDGYEVFSKRCADRIYHENYDELNINLCPNCKGIARTPQAKQCRFCGYSWHNPKKLIVLDLDETLVHATSKDIANWDFEVGKYKVIKRPYLDDFLKQLSNHYKIGVWSSASDDYVIEVVKKAFPVDYHLEFIWGRSKCTYKIDYSKIEEQGYADPFAHGNYVKPLKKLKKLGIAPIEHILIVDDTPFKCAQNYGNAIYPTEFTGNPKDQELLRLAKYLMEFKDLKNVRTIEKRNWQSKF